MAEIINGKEISKTIREEISSRVKKLFAKNIVPGLAVILVGDDPASNVYVNMKEKACISVGINSIVNRLPIDASQETVLDLIKEYNEDVNVHGILIQHPLPPTFDEPYVFGNVDPQKDVDGFHPVNAGKLLIGEEGFVPCTPLGVVEMLHRSGNPPAGKHVVIVGRSSIVGKPLAALLVQKKRQG